MRSSVEILNAVDVRLILLVELVPVFHPLLLGPQKTDQKRCSTICVYYYYIHVVPVYFSSLTNIDHR